MTLEVFFKLLAIFPMVALGWLSGRVAWIEFRLEDDSVPIKTLHKMSEAQVKKEAAVQPLEWEKTIGSAPWQHIILFRKKADK